MRLPRQLKRKQGSSQAQKVSAHMTSSRDQATAAAAAAGKASFPPAARSCRSHLELLVHNYPGHFFFSSSSSNFSESVYICLRVHYARAELLRGKGAAGLLVFEKLAKH